VVSLLLFFSWQSVWILAAGVAALAVPALLWLLVEERSPQSSATEGQSLGMSGRHWSRNQALRHPLFWFMIPALLGQSAFNTAFFFLQVHFAEIKGWEHLQLVAMFPVYTLVSIAAMILSGILLDKLDTAFGRIYFPWPILRCKRDPSKCFLGRVLRHETPRFHQGGGGGCHGFGLCDWSRGDWSFVRLRSTP